MDTSAHQKPATTPNQADYRSWMSLTGAMLPHRVFILRPGQGRCRGAAVARGGSSSETFECQRFSQAILSPSRSSPALIWWRLRATGERVVEGSHFWPAPAGVVVG